MIAELLGVLLEQSERIIDRRTKFCTLKIWVGVGSETTISQCGGFLS